MFLISDILYFNIFNSPETTLNCHWIFIFYLTAINALDKDQTKVSTEGMGEGKVHIDLEAHSCEEKIAFISEVTSDVRLDAPSNQEAFIIEIPGKWFSASS